MRREYYMVSGHLSEAVFKKYVDHIETKNIQEVGEAAAQAFENILQFRKVVLYSLVLT